MFVVSLFLLLWFLFPISSFSFCLILFCSFSSNLFFFFYSIFSSSSFCSFFLLLPFYILYISYTIVHIHISLIRTVTSSRMLSIWKVSHSYMITFTSTKDNVKRGFIEIQTSSFEEHGKSLHTSHFTHVQHTPNTHSTHYIDLCNTH